MSRRLWFILLILLCFILFTTLTYLLLVSKSGYPVHNLSTGLNYANIQAAIDAPETLDGHTILINAQTYYEHVVVKKSLLLIGESEDHTIIDGNGTGNIIHIITSNVTIKNLTVKNGTIGVYVDYSNNSCVTKIIAIKNTDAIIVRYSHNCTIQQSIVGNNTGRGILITNSQGFNINNNNVYGNQMYGINANFSVSGSIKQNEANKNYYDGIGMFDSGDCVVTENNVSNSSLYGIIVEGSYNLSIYNNNFINNPDGQAGYAGLRRALWDNGYPSGGNYWSNYAETDLASGPFQNETGSDGIGDTPYKIDANNTDNYPLIGMFWSFNTAYDYGVNIVSNSLISDFGFSLSGARQAMLTFNVSGATGTQGFCRICIPKALINASYVVNFDGEILTYKELPCSNETYEYLYINYTQSEHKIEITGTTPIA